MANHFTGTQRPLVAADIISAQPASPPPPPRLPALPQVVGIALDSGTENATQMVDDIAVLKSMDVAGSAGVNALWLDAGWYLTDPNMSAPIGSGGRNWFDGYGEKNGAFFLQLFRSCLSRACLGKSTVFI